MSASWKKALMGSLVVGLAAAMAPGCTLISASGLDECKTSADCGSEKVCQQGLCIPLPTGCTATPYGSQDASAIPVGGLFPVHNQIGNESDTDESDQQAFNAALLALEQINQRGLTNAGGKPFAMYYCDTYNNVDRAKAQAAWLVNEKKVSAMITAGSDQTLGVAQSVTIPANVVIVSYSATSTELTPLQDRNGGSTGLVWRTPPSDSIQGAVIANLLRNDARFGSPKKVAILYVNSAYGQGLDNIVADQLSSAPAITNRGFTYDRNVSSTSLAQTMDALNTYAPNITVLVGFSTDVVNILNAASTRANLKRGSGHQWFFSDSVKDQSVLANATASAQAQDYYGTAAAQGAGQAFRTFESTFLSRFNKDPADYAYTSNAYDAMYLIALGAAYSQGAIGSVTGPKLAEGLTKVSATQLPATQLVSSKFVDLTSELAAGRSVNVDGASGPLDFNNDTGDAPAPIELWQVKGSDFSTVEVIQPPSK